MKEKKNKNIKGERKKNKILKVKENKNKNIKGERK